MTKRTGRASVVIDQTPAVVWAGIADITRMGEWSPECLSGRWIGDATAPGVGARFKGDNEARFAGRTVKRWTTTSEVTECEPFRLFAFVAEGYTTWRYTFEPSGTGTRVTESFEYEPKGLQGFLLDTLLRRSAAMARGMERTLARVKEKLEA